MIGILNGRWLPRVGLCALLSVAIDAGIALSQPPSQEALTWTGLLAPYSAGAPLPEGYRIDALCPGSSHDVIIMAGRPTDHATIEIHILPRGQWNGIRESQSFGIGYETPHSAAAAREAVTEFVAGVIRSRDHG